MAANRDLALRLIIEAVDNATKDITGVHEQVQALKEELLRSEFERTAEGARKLGQRIAELTEPATAATQRLVALNAALVAAGSVMAGAAYRESVRYESALSDLAKVLEGGRTEAERHGAALNDLALQYGQNGQELVGSLANFVQAGYETREAFKLVEDAIKLMIAGDVDAAEASQRLIAILKGFDAPASEAARAVDILNEVSNRYATNVKQLAAGMAELSPIAKQAGFGLEETAGLLTPIIEVFQSGAEAGEALKTTLLRLSDDSKPVTDALEALGVAQRDANGQLRSGKDIFTDVANAMRGLSDAERSYYTQQLVGIDQSARAAIVFGQYAKVLDVTAAASEAAGSAAAEVGTRLETSETAIRRSEEQFRQLATTLGNNFKAEITGVVGATGELANALNSAFQSGKLEPLLAALRPQIEALQRLISSVAENLESALAGIDWRPLVDGLRAVSGEFGEAFAALFDGIDVTTIEGLRRLLQGIVNLLGNFAQTTAGALDGLEPFLDSLNAMFELITRERPELSRLVGEITGLATSANMVIPVIAEFANGVFTVIGRVVKLTAEIWLLTYALRALSAAGIPVGAMFTRLIGILGQAALLFGRLPVHIAGVASALMGLPGLVTAAGAAALGLGYKLGTLIGELIEGKDSSEEAAAAVAKLGDQYEIAAQSVEEAAQRAADAQQRLQARLDEAIQKGEEHAQMEILRGERLAALSQQEVEAYAERLKAAERYWEATAIQQERAGQSSEYAMERTNAYREALEALSGQRAAHNQWLIEQAELNQRVADAVAGLQIVQERQADQLLKISKALRESAKNLGIDIEQSLTGIGSKVRERLADFETLRQGLEDMGVEGARAGEVLTQSLAKIAQESGTRQELDRVRQVAVALGQEGAASGQQLLAVYQAIEAKARDLGDAEAKYRQQLEESKAAISKRATELTAMEYAQAAALRQRQIAAQQAEAAAQKSEDAWQKSRISEFKAGEQAVSLYAQMRNALAQYSAEAVEMFDYIGRTAEGTNDWFRNIVWGQKVLEEMELAKQGVDELTAQIQHATATGEGLAQAARATAGSFGNLDQQHLVGLQNAIDAARSKLESLRASAEATLRSLQVELAQLNNDAFQVEQLQYLQKRGELEAKIEEAGKTGDARAIAAYQNSIVLLDQIHQKKLANIQADRAAAKEREREAAAEARKAETDKAKAETDRKKAETDALRAETARKITEAERASPAERRRPSERPAVSVQTIRLELVLPRGRTVSASMPRDEAKPLFDLLEQARRSAS